MPDHNIFENGPRCQTCADPKKLVFCDDVLVGICLYVFPGKEGVALRLNCAEMVKTRTMVYETITGHIKYLTLEEAEQDRGIVAEYAASMGCACAVDGEYIYPDGHLKECPQYREFETLGGNSSRP